MFSSTMGIGSGAGQDSYSKEKASRLIVIMLYMLVYAICDVIMYSYY